MRTVAERRGFGPGAAAIGHGFGHLLDDCRFDEILVRQGHNVSFQSCLQEMNNIPCHEDCQLGCGKQLTPLKYRVLGSDRRECSSPNAELACQEGVWRPVNWND